VIVARVDPNLGLVAEPAECLRVDDPIAVPLEGRTQATRFFFSRAPARVVGADGERREPAFFVLPNAELEGFGNSTGELGHAGKASSSSGRRGSAPGSHP
jgi:hypothetical protein